MLAGSDFVSGAKNILKREVFTVDANKTATMAGTVVTGSLSVYELDEDGFAKY